jgi:hypothetical protein
MVDGGQQYMGKWYGNYDLLSKALGTPIHPGSINVFVSAVGRPELRAGKLPFFPRDDIPDPQSILARGSFSVRDCQINGHAGFVLRTEHPGRAYDGPNHPVPTRLPQPNTMFEVVAPFIPGIADGVEVDFVFDPDAELRTVSVR